MSELPKHANTKFQRWYSKQTAQGKKDFAARIGRGAGMIRASWIIPIGKPLPTHYTKMEPTAARPTALTMRAMSKATDGCCNYNDMLRHFYPNISDEELVPYTTGREFLKPHTMNRC